MSFESTFTDATILGELGQRLAKVRLESGLTQAELAAQAGVSKRTVERIEAGESTQTTTLVRLLRALGLLEALEQAMPASAPRPLELLKLKGKERQRASKKQRRQAHHEPWSWGDDA